MHIEHAAMYVRDLEAMRRFYEEFFGTSSNEIYRNERTGFSSYFLTFSEGCRLELMHNDTIDQTPGENATGYHHLALSVGSKDAVDDYTQRLTKAGFECISGPRTTGDGYYESVILDPEKNRIEITV